MNNVYSIFISFLLLTITFPAFSQDAEFTDLSPMPIGKSALTSANDGSNIYVANGFSTEAGYTSDILKYNISSGSWSVLTDNSIEKRFASCAIVGSHLYVFNGLLPTQNLNTRVEKIDLQTGEIEIMGDNPVPRRISGTAVYNNQIYSFGGTYENNEPSDLVLRFDPLTDTWDVLATMPEALQTKGEIYNDKLYYFGGFNGNVSAHIQIYDLINNVWEPGITMPVGISANATALVGDKIYLVGDFANLTYLATFNLTDRSFQILENNMVERRHAAAEGIDGQLYAIGGNTTSQLSSATDNFQVFEATVSTVRPTDRLVIKTYPNPAADRLFFEQDFEELFILNISGQIIARYQKAQNEIDISQLKPGCYFLQGKNDQQIFFKKWLKH